MNVRTKPGGRETQIPARGPSPLARLLYFLGAPAVGLVVVVFSRGFGWSLAQMLQVGAIAGALYVLVATPLLLARRG
ncbi:MAG: hypothetical protein ACRDHM_08155 [Actinomycetota bacterium]